MFNREENIKDEIILMTLSEIVPKDHFLKKVAEAIDFKFIYDLTEKYYSLTSGRNSLDPVVLFKLVFLKDFYGIKSMRETIKRIETDAAFRWIESCKCMNGEKREGLAEVIVAACDTVRLYKKTHDLVEKLK